MDQKALTDLNIGENLDNLAYLDPRGYGVCRILYKASREYTGMPTTMNAAKKLCATLKKDDIVYIMTGFVLLDHHHAETDGIVSSMLLARALSLAFDVKPVNLPRRKCGSRQKYVKGDRSSPLRYYRRDECSPRFHGIHPIHKGQR